MKKEDSDSLARQEDTNLACPNFSEHRKTISGKTTTRVEQYVKWRPTRFDARLLKRKLAPEHYKHSDGTLRLPRIGCSRATINRELSALGSHSNSPDGRVWSLPLRISNCTRSGINAPAFSSFITSRPCSTLPDSRDRPWRLGLLAGMAAGLRDSDPQKKSSGQRLRAYFGGMGEGKNKNRAASRST